MSSSRPRPIYQQPVAWVVLVVVYVVLGLVVKSVVLNWIIGPIFPLLGLYLLPRLLRREAPADG